jgi:hypothetical protein
MKTPANLAITFFEMPALPKGFLFYFNGAAMCPSTFGKAAQVFTNVGRLPSLASSNRWLHLG